MSEKKSAEEYPQLKNLLKKLKYVASKSIIVSKEDNSLMTEIESLLSQSRTTLTLEEEQAMDGIKFPVKYDEMQGIIFDSNGKDLMLVLREEVDDATTDNILAIITRLLNAEQERRGK